MRPDTKFFTINSVGDIVVGEVYLSQISAKHLLPGDLVVTTSSPGEYYYINDFLKNNFYCGWLMSKTRGTGGAYYSSNRTFNSNLTEGVYRVAPALVDRILDLHGMLYFIMTQRHANF